MQLDEARRAEIADLATTVLQALQNVADAAQLVFAVVHAPDPKQILAVHTNTLVHGSGATARRFQVGEAEARQILLRLTNEPFVARVKVSWEGEGRETI